MVEEANERYRCPLCERDVPQVSAHHLVPRSRGGAREAKVPICVDCHGAIHALFSNRRLAQELSSVEALKAEERFVRHLRWLAKQDPGRRNRTRRAKDQRQQRRGG